MGISGIGPHTGYTPLDMFVAQSDENLQRATQTFDEALKQGYGIEMAADEALRALRLTKWDFTASDWQRLSRHVENAAASRSSHD